MTVYLVGAGPGDPGLMTVRGLELIKRADVILYDRLVNSAVLDHAKGHCAKIFVGKEPGRHHMRQDEINELLVRCGKEHDCVVRLKGGDPFVFGRGGEEMDSLMENGIPFEVVPGITSAIAGPAYAGMPVTRRGTNSSVTFLTGHNWDSSRLRDTAGTLSGTLVILMGASSFPLIGEDLIAMGYDPETPVAVISNATSYSQSAASGTIRSMMGAKITHPSVIVVGEAAAIREGGLWFERKLGTMRRKKVLVMRAPDQFEDTRKLLEGLGAQALNGGCYKLTPIKWDRRDLENSTHAVITSANTVPIIREDLLANRGKAYVAIGPGTKRALEGIGISAEMPDEYTSEGLGMLLRRIAGPDDKIVGLRSSKASKVLGSMLSDLDYREVPVYDICYEGLHEKNVADADIILFTSTAMVEAICRLVRDEQVRISIGPQTTSSLRSHGMPPHFEAAASTIESMISGAMDYLYSLESGRHQDKT